MSTVVSMKELHEVVRLRTFNHDGDDLSFMFERILELIQSERATGKLIVNFHQGGVGSFQFEEKQRIQLPTPEST